MTKLFEQASEHFAIDRKRSFVVGDTGSDVEAAERLAARACLVRSGRGRLHEDEYGRRADAVCDGVLEPAAWIIARRRRV